MLQGHPTDRGGGLQQPPRREFDLGRSFALDRSRGEGAQLRWWTAKLRDLTPLA